MDADLAPEWKHLVARAREAVRTGSRAPSGYQPVMQVVVLPSFDVWSRYELFASRSGPSQGFVAAHSMCDLNEEIKKFESPTERARHPGEILPSVIRKTAAADPDAARSLLDSIAGIQIPPIPTNAHFGLDGTTVEVTFGALFTELRFRWWRTPPDGWEVIGHIADELVGLVLRAAG